MLYLVNEGFNETEVNPFTGRPYNDSWIIFSLTNTNDYHILNGGSNSVYTLKVSKHYPQWKMSVFDFLEYQNTYNKNIILSISAEDYEAANKQYGNHHYNDRFLRDYEPDVLIHSTTQKNWARIESEGYLKSWNRLKSERINWEVFPIGRYLGDPADFSDFIMFSGGGISSEIVVLSKQIGKITMDQDMQYITGARLYFDVKKIAADGLLIRDGCHLKVKDTLPLDPYLLWVGTWRSVGLSTPLSTPKEFTELSNSTFNKLFNKNVNTSY